MRTSNLLAVGIAVVVLGLGTGVSVGADDDDHRIEAAAKNSYVFRTYLKADDITVEAKDGTVTLSGTVAEESHKMLARDTANGLPGVKHVDDHLQIKAPEAATMSDDLTSARVKFALLFHRSVSAATRVHVKDGVVTLSGSASSPAQKDLTAEYAREVTGVKDVINKMTVAPAPAEPTLAEKIDDASITAEVKVTLLLHRSTSALRTEVTTNNGVVTLRGSAKNQAEIDLAAKLVRDIRGVKDVKNRMTVGG